jgi:hypothetical protein
MSRHIEFNLPRQTFTDMYEQHLRAMSILNDDEELVISYNPKHLKGTDETIPVVLDIYKTKDLITNGTTK